jgi:hypothetical protein
VVEVRGHIVFLESDDLGYHARQVKVVPDTNASSESGVSEPETEEATDPGIVRAQKNRTERRTEFERSDRLHGLISCVIPASEEDKQSSPAEASEAEEPVVVPAVSSAQNRPSSVVDPLQYSRPGKLQVPLSVKAIESLGGGWRQAGNEEVYD